MLGKTLAMRSADQLREGQLIIIDTHFFPKNDEDAIEFRSEELTVIDVTEKYFNVRDKYGETAKIPIEDYTTVNGTVIKHIKSPVPDTAFFIWVIYNNFVASIVDNISQIHQPRI